MRRSRRNSGEIPREDGWAFMFARELVNGDLDDKAMIAIPFSMNAQSQLVAQIQIYCLSLCEMLFRH